MNESMVGIIAGSVSVLLIAMAVVMAKLWREQKKLKQDCQALRAQIQRGSDDVAGLCSAAIAVDKRLSANESRLRQFLDDINASQPKEQPRRDEVFDAEDREEDARQGYAHAIEKIRGGTSLDELVKSCGLTRDEAVLLMRLHGR